MTTDLTNAIDDIERFHKDADSLADTVIYHWPTIKAGIAKIEAEAAAMRVALIGAVLIEHDWRKP